MISKLKIGQLLVSGTVYLLFFWGFANAQVQDNRWSVPKRLSSEGTVSTEGFMVADQFGYVHVFWYEYDPPSGLSTLQYSRFDGKIWTDPVDLFIIQADATNAHASPFVDQLGILHLVWTDTQFGPINYSQVLVEEAVSAQNWQKPIRLNIPAGINKLVVDSRGVIHVLYAAGYGDQPGVYYMRSADQGWTWQNPVWLDPDNLPNYTPRTIQFALDEADGLHAVWYYEDSVASRGDWIRYARSIDGGESWSSPFTIDKDNEDSGRLYFSDPVMIVSGQSVHIVWASNLNRWHRYSSNAGLNWSSPARFMGDLEGQAFDGLAVDGADRVHFLSQIRYPKGIYHAYWDQDGWSFPSLVYLIQWTSNEVIGDRIEAHDVHPVVRAGNQLVVTFASEPGDRERQMYFIARTLDDIPQETVIPLPTSTPIPLTDQVESTLTSTITPVVEPITVDYIPPAPNYAHPSNLLWIALIPSLLLLGGIVLYQVRRKS